MTLPDHLSGQFGYPPHIWYGYTAEIGLRCRLGEPGCQYEGCDCVCHATPSPEFQAVMDRLAKP